MYQISYPFLSLQIPLEEYMYLLVPSATALTAAVKIFKIIFFVQNNIGTALRMRCAVLCCNVLHCITLHCIVLLSVHRSSMY